MVGKVVEILSAWYTSYNPDKEQKIIAEERASVCDGCFYKTEMEDSILKTIVNKRDRELNKFKCGFCGCPLAKKIFSPFNTCPKNKWSR